MAAFFVTVSGMQCPVARIKNIGARAISKSGSIPYFEVLMTDGDQVLVHDYEIDRITQGPSHIIPAVAGTFILGGIEYADENVEAVWQTPVICWAINDEGEVKPYTSDGVNDGLSEGQPLLMPNGIVVSPGDRSWRNLEEWFKFESGEVRRRLDDAKAHASKDPEPERPTDGSPPEVFERHTAWAERNPF